MREIPVAWRVQGLIAPLKSKWAPVGHGVWARCSGEARVQSRQFWQVHFLSCSPRVGRPAVTIPVYLQASCKGLQLTAWPWLILPPALLMCRAATQRDGPGLPLATQGRSQRDLTIGCEILSRICTYTIFFFLRYLNM